MEPSNYLMLVISSCFLFFLVVAGKESAFKRSEEGEIEAKSRHYQTFPLSSFQPSSICSPSTNGEKKRGSLEVVHKHGPCSKFNKDIVKPLTVEEIFTHDQSRVDSINSRLRAAITTTGKDDTKTSMTTLRAKRGTTIDSSNYIVTIGLGTPKKSLSLNFDTGSDLTWTQCEPCISCYKQHEPIFSPSSSTTYTNISCTSADCSGLASATLQPPGCISSNCVYTIRYGDGSLTQGFFVKDTLTITSDDVFDGFFFGCGQNNSGLFGGDAGLIGLGRDKLSLVMQSANKYGKVFSYCLPSTDSSIGFLKFGSNGIGSNVIYTPLVDDSQQRSSFYNLDLEAIYVGEKKLEINPTVFKTSGMIIDSGTVITWLPLPAYLALREAFKVEMTQYDTVNASSILDTCYDFSKYGDGNVTIPTISFVWGGNVKMEIPRQGVFSKHEEQVYCLAFRGNEDDSDTGIFGNTQQKTMEVVYDVAAGKVGFGPSGCA